MEWVHGVDGWGEVRVYHIFKRCVKQYSKQKLPKKGKKNLDFDEISLYNYKPFVKEYGAWYENDCEKKEIFYEISLYNYKQYVKE